MDSVDDVVDHLVARLGMTLVGGVFAVMTFVELVSFLRAFAILLPELFPLTSTCRFVRPIGKNVFVAQGFHFVGKECGFCNIRW